jgi:hypothetical protein
VCVCVFRVVHVDLHARAWGPRVTVIFAACVVFEQSSGVYLPLSPYYRLCYLYLLLEQRTLIHPRYRRMFVSGVGVGWNTMVKRDKLKNCETINRSSKTEN